MNKEIKQGVKDFKEGNIGNPYQKNTKKNRDWELGFTRAYYTNLKRINGEGDDKK